MKYKKLSIIFFALFIFIPLQAELLIIKKTKDKDGQEQFAPLDLEDKADNAAAPIIAQIILKYEWPMCIASDLTEAEKNELLTPGKPYAEEKFIQKKIDEAFKPGTYYVVFIPTCVYELFCIDMYLSDYEKRNRFMRVSKCAAGVDLKDILAKYSDKVSAKTENAEYEKIVIAAKKEILNVFTKINATFFDIDKNFFNANAAESAFVLLNQYITQFIFKKYIDSAKVKSIDVLTTSLKEKMVDITGDLIKHVIETYKKLQKEYLGADTLNNIVQQLEKEKNDQIVSKVMTLEYEARSINKGLLLRGAQFVLLKEREEEDTTNKKILGIPYGFKDPKDKNYNLYKEQVAVFLPHDSTGMYSLSFGNALFAGAVYDSEACSYFYLTKIDIQTKNKSRATGYALFINKKAYVKNQNDDLFFIPPLSAIAAVFQRGEFFHARSKVAALDTWPSSGRVKIEGLEASINDNIRFLVVNRNKFKHAELLSKFLADNGQIIQVGDSSSLTEEEKKILDELIKNQREATRFYKTAQVVEKAGQKFMKPLKKEKKIEPEK